MTINEVLELLNKEGYDQVPVVDDVGYACHVLPVCHKWNVVLCRIW